MNADTAPDSVKIQRGIMKCPACRGRSVIRDSEEVTPLVRDLYFICMNVDCGHTWKAQLGFVYSLSPSAIPHDLDLPAAPDDYQRRRYPPAARDRGHDPGDPNQISIFDHLASDQAA
ncbi:MAG: hypothetical protein A2792_00225 [Sphingomonadales bacterium RIFCSPHIGHO2_01_FULL_65_20]|nr:MAG: hypothetical protein A2792_00225 [Sphingomonadales bacterium RIFCSPHIGHO2_01_FULL_65_20]